MQGEDLKVIYSGPDLQTPSDMGRAGAGGGCWISFWVVDTGRNPCGWELAHRAEHALLTSADG